MTVEADLVVIGSGSAGQSVAFACREAGWSVVVIDSNPFGGTCQLRGCDPKKVLVGVSDLVDHGRRMQGRGLGAPASALDWQALIDFKQTFVDGVPEANEQRFLRAGIKAVHGRACFVGETSLEVGDETYAARHVVIAAGARHRPLGIPGEELLTTSTGFLNLRQLPRRVVMVGGGYIAFELAHVAAAGGATVTVLSRSEPPLTAFDPDLVANLVQGTQESGIELRTSTAVTRIERDHGELVVHAEGPQGSLELRADLVVHAAGRVPEIDDLNLQAAGVERDPGGITVNDHLQSVSNPAVYAAGDAVASGGLPLTPVAGMQGRVVAANLLHGNTETPDYRGIPSVLFTTPVLARVGLLEDSARAQGLHFTVHHEDTAGWYTSRRVALAHAAFKTLVEEGSGRILGAHILGPEAEELINVFALAIRHGLTAQDLRSTVFAYPTAASDISYML